MKDLLRVGRCDPPFSSARSRTAGMQSKVHPTYKTKYRGANWPAYNRALVRRADVRASHDSCNNAGERARARSRR